MAYQINYYADRAMRHREVDTDTVGDRSILLGHYPAPTGGEVALARHSENKELDLYGYDGGWHHTPPRETIEADERDAQAAQLRKEAREYASQPHVSGFLRHDRNTLVVRRPGRRESAYVRLSDLRLAARQDDPELRAIYSRLLAEAEDFLREQV